MDVVQAGHQFSEKNIFYQIFIGRIGSAPGHHLFFGDQRSAFRGDVDFMTNSLAFDRFPATTAKFWSKTLRVPGLPPALFPVILTTSQRVFWIRFHSGSALYKCVWMRASDRP
jgi:hypothetical protein